MSVMRLVCTRGSARRGPYGVVSAPSPGAVTAAVVLCIVIWWPQVSRPVRTMLVQVREVLIQDRVQVPRPGDQHAVGDLGPHCAHPAFGIGVCSWATRRIFTTSVATPASTASNASVNCPARSRIRNRNSVARSPRSISRFRACCTVHAPSGARSRPGHAHDGCPPQHEEHIHAAQGHRAVHMEEIARQHCSGLGAQELPPSGSCALGCGGIRSRFRIRRTVDAPTRYPRPAVHLGSACNPSPGSPAPSARSAPRASASTGGRPPR